MSGTRTAKLKRRHRQNGDQLHVVVAEVAARTGCTEEQAEQRLVSKRLTDSHRHQARQRRFR